MNRTSMGPKPKIYSGSSKNTGGPLVRNRRDREEFSDNEPISEDDQDYPDDQDQEEQLPGIASSVNQERNIQNTSKGHGRGQNEEKRARTSHKEVDDITRPKKKETLPQKSLPEQIFTPVFLYQLVIISVYVLLLTFCSAFILSKIFRVSDISYRNNDKVINVDWKVQNAIATEIDKADIDGKVQNALATEIYEADINGKVQNALATEIHKSDIDGKVQKAVGIKLPDALNKEVPKIVRVEAKSAVKGEDMINVIQTQVLENNEGIKRDVEKSLSSKITNAYKKSLDKEFGTLEEAISSIAKFHRSLESFEQIRTEVETNVSMLHDNITSARHELLATRVIDLGTIDKLQNRIQDAEDKLNKITKQSEKLDEMTRLYEQYKIKVRQLDEIRSRMDIIQPNMFNKDSFITAFMILIVIVLLLAVSVYNLYQRSNNDIPGRTGRRATAEQSNNVGHHEVLRSIPGGEELGPGVCIISFDESRATTHKRILDTANISNCRIEGHVIRKHEHIPKLPRCKVYLMCTEFSERHVIIEEPGKGLGDLHRTTYDAVMKLGGCLIILYTRDPGSRNLKDKVRYNERIYCVSNQPELAKLNQDGGFFSIYDNLNNYQKTELRRKISENMT